MRMELSRVLGALSLGFLCVGVGAQTLKVYDNFDSNQIFPTKWSRETMERRSEISNGTLRMLQRDWASTASNSGREGRSYSTPMSNAPLITQIKGTVRVAAYELVGCSVEGSAVTEGWARLLGIFFNTGNRTNGSNVGDMLAQILIVRASNMTSGADVLDVRGNLFLCSDATCQNGTSIGSVALGTATLNSTVSLQMEWDKPNKRFIFSRDGGVTTGEVPYTQNDSNFPGAAFTGVGTRTSVANCTQSPRPRVMLDARFDQVQVNKSAIR